MVVPDFSGDFLNFDSTQDGDVCKILDEGKVEWSENLKKDMFNIKVLHNEKTKTYSPNNKIGKALQDAFGVDTKDWVGKSFTIFHLDKKMLVKPIVE